MNYYYICPAVYGELGPQSILEFSNHDMNVVKLEYVFDGWSGKGWKEDQILTTTPCFICTTTLMERLLEAKLTGLKFGEVIVSKSEEMQFHQPNVILPEFARMYLETTPNDIYLCNGPHLIVSERALSIIGKESLPEAKIFLFDPKNPVFPSPV